MVFAQIGKYGLFSFAKNCRLDAQRAGGRAGGCSNVIMDDLGCTAGWYTVLAADREWCCVAKGLVLIGGSSQVG